MPAKSRSQQRLFAAAQHGAQFRKAKQLRATTTPAQREEFARGSMKGKPAHVKHPPNRYGDIGRHR